MFQPKIDRIEYGGAMIDQEEIDAIMNVIKSQGGRRWTIGQESVAFEKELAEKIGVKRAVVVNSGSSALLIAVASLKLPKGTRVAIPAVNFPTAFNAILQNGLVPYVVDVDIQTLNLDLDKLAELVQVEKLGAVIAVNIAGNPVDYPRLRQIVGDDVYIICDNCDGSGTTLNGKYIDTYADISCVSFHAAHIITMGEGGAILTDNDKIADTALKMREWGRASGTDNIYKYPGFPNDYKERYVYEEIGYNLKPLELQCAMGRVQLKKLEQFVEARRNNYNKMRLIFEKYPQKFTLMQHIGEPCWFSFPFLCSGVERSKVMDELESNNIECRTIFSGNITRHPAYKDVEFETMPIINADIVMRDGMFLSVHPSITNEMIEFIDQVISKI